MNSFTFAYPTTVYFGEGSVKTHLETILSQYGDRIMFAYGFGSIKRNGIFEEIMSILEGLHKNVVLFDGIMPNPTMAKVKEGAKLAKEEHIDLILAVGGGSVIDCCKMIAAQAMIEDDIWKMQIEEGKFPAIDPIPLGAIVTASGTGSEMNGGAVITNEEQNVKTALFAQAPKFAVLDPAYTLSVPFKQVISGAFDTLSHAMETYFGRSDRDHVSDDVAEAIMKNTIQNIRVLLKDPKDLIARGNLIWDSAMAENGILKIGKFTDFEVHQIEHQLGAYTDCNHGQGLAVLHPGYYHNIYPHAIDKFARFAQNVWGIAMADRKAQALAGVEALASFIKECGLPTKLSELSMKDSADKLLSDENLRSIADSCNIVTGGYYTLTHDEIFTLLKECR